MQKSNILTIEDIVFRNHLKERNCLWLPVPLPVVSDVPSDVALWLFELRHLSDTTDSSIPDNVKLSADCDTLINELWTCEDGGDGSEILKDVLGQENFESTDETESKSHNGSGTPLDKEINECRNYQEKVKNSELIVNVDNSKENCNTSSKLDTEVLKDINEVQSGETIQYTLRTEDLKDSNSQLQSNGNINLSVYSENQKQEECQKNEVIDGDKQITEESKDKCEQSKNIVKIPENTKTSKQDINIVNNAQSVLDEEKIKNDSKQNEENVNMLSAVKSEFSKENKTANFNDEKITRPHTFGGGDLATYTQTHRSVCILWEANPLYGAVGDKGKEGSGRGFRKLCYSSIEELGNSISNSPGERTSDSISLNYKPPIFQDKIFCHFSADNAVNSNSDTCESELNSMQKEVIPNTSANTEDKSNHIDSDDQILQSEHQSTIQIGSYDTSRNDVASEKFQSEDSDCENAENLLTSVNGSDNRESPKMSYDEQCEEVLNNLERVIESLEVEDEETQDFVIEPDSDFLELCKEADDLAEESIQQCPPVAPVIPRVTIVRSVTMSSDLSDDVFVNSPSKEEGPILYPAVTEVRRHHSLDINTIFDDGTKPPVPPARKKRSRDKDRYKTVPQIKTSSSCTSISVETKSLNEQENTEVRETVDVNEIQGAHSTHEVILDSNFLNFENQPQELAIIKRVTDMTKEKRNAKVASQYEDANSCCQQCHAGECNLSTCLKNSNVVTISNPTSSTPITAERVSVSEESGQVLGINVTPLRPICTVEFPPSENVYKRHSAIPILENLSMNSCDDSGISLPSDSVLKNRKGSTSSDIEAWKEQLLMSGFSYLDEGLDIDYMFPQEEWFSSNDSEGRIYFFEENSNESSWTLPELRVTTCDSPAPTKLSSKETKMGAKKPTKQEKQLEGVVQLRSDQLGKEPEAKNQYRMAKAHSMAMLESSSGKQASSKSSSFPRNWPQLWDGNMCVLKEGTLNRTKITENGKKVRKNWAPAHVVLTELLLLFFKDAKTFTAMKNAQEESSSAARPEFSVDLNGASLERGEKASSRRNVFLVSALLGLQVLVQCESGSQAEEWYQAIQKAITNLPSAYDSCPRNKAPKLSPPPFLGSNSPEEFKKSSRIGRSRSVKAVKLTAKEVGSQEDLTFSPDENQTKIKNRLKKFFNRRPTKDSLVKKGIYKDEPVFGCLLSQVCKGESPKVPAFVQRCIAAIECKEENMKTDGLYRASGNLSQVQKIRLQVDQNNLSILEQEEDVHVLTGALKLFFRELKVPLIPFECFNKALKASTNQNKKEKLQQFRDIVKALPHPNRDTLEYLLRHLLRVTKFQDSNRMHIPNLAIVFGPTLMWPEEESANMALDLMQQNLVIECFLQEFESIFR